MSEIEAELREEREELWVLREEREALWEIRELREEVRVLRKSGARMMSAWDGLSPAQRSLAAEHLGRTVEEMSEIVRAVAANLRSLEGVGE